jgi:death-on-curing protein
MIALLDAINIQRILIEKFGGATGIRDRNLLESALIRPYQTFDGKELYETPVKKAAAIIESIVTNHPFVDGNKRFGYVAMRLILMDSGLDLSATQQAKYNFVLKIAKGDLRYDGIHDWIMKNVKQK